MKKINIWKKITGFTLIELMVTLSIVGILLVIGVPSFTTTIQNNRLTTAANSLFAGIGYARVEAINRNQNVIFCGNSDPTADGEGDNAQCSATYTTGWLVASDASTLGTVDVTDAVLKVHKSFPGMVMTKTNIGANEVIMFQGNGIGRKVDITTGAVATLTGAPNAAVIKLCDNRAGNFGKEIRFSTLGLARVSAGIACP